MAFKRGHYDREEADRQVREILNNMATYAEMFGGGKKNYVRIQNEDESFVGIFVDWTRVDRTDIKSKKKLFLVQFEDGEKYQRKEEGDFDPESVNNHFALTQIELTLELDGVTWTWTLSDSAEEAFKSAMKKAGQLKPGDTVGGKLIDKDSKPYKWKFQIIPQED